MGWRGGGADLLLFASSCSAPAAIAHHPFPPDLTSPHLASLRVPASFRPASPLISNHPDRTLRSRSRREQVLGRLAQLVREWVRDTCISKGVPPAVAAQAGGQIFVSGSYKLGVARKGADIDVICVAPAVVTADDFFGDLDAFRAASGGGGGGGFDGLSPEMAAAMAAATPVGGMLGLLLGERDVEE